MNNMNCYSCSKALTKENDSREHVFPNFLGGKLILENALCIDCNSQFGSTIDRELYRQLGFAADIIVAKRDRTKNEKGVEIETLSGKKARVGHKLVPKPKLCISLPNNAKKVELIGKDDENLKTLAKRKKSELEIKHGKFSFTESMEQPTSEKFHFKNSLSEGTGSIGFGGPKYFRGVAKIILNFHLKVNPLNKQPAKLIDFVCGLAPKNDFLFIYHPTCYVVHEMNRNEFSHLIYLRGEREIKALYCYLEIFNFEKFICVIDDQYDGEDYIEQYCYDALSDKVLQKQISIRLYRHHIEDLKFIALGHKTQRQLTFNDFEKRVERLQDYAG